MASAELVSRDANVARIKVAFDAAEIDEHFRGVYKEYARTLVVPGFRKGKVPANVVRQRVGAEAIASAAGEALRDLAVDEGLRQLGLAARQGRVTWHTEADPQEGAPAEVEFSLPVLPEVHLPDYAGFEFSLPGLELSDAMKQRYYERLAEAHTHYDEKQGPAEQGDALLISFASKLAADGGDAPLKHEGLLYVLGKEGNLPGWDEKLTGKAAGESFEFPYALPDNFADQRVAGKELVVAMSVTSVHSVSVPVIDEAFVKEHLHHASWEEFEQYADTSLRLELDAQREQMKRDLAMKRIVDEVQADITEDMVGTEIDGMVKENDRTLRKYDSSLEEYFAQKGTTLVEYRESLRPTALARIKYFLAVRAIAEEQKLDATAEDFERYAYYLMRREGINAQQFKELLGYPEFLSEATYQIVREKVLDHVAAVAKYAIGGAPEPEAPAE